MVSCRRCHHSVCGEDMAQSCRDLRRCHLQPTWAVPLGVFLGMGLLRETERAHEQMGGGGQVTTRGLNSRCDPTCTRKLSRDVHSLGGCLHVQLLLQRTGLGFTYPLVPDTPVPDRSGSQHGFCSLWGLGRPFSGMALLPGGPRASSLAPPPQGGLLSPREVRA